MVPRAEPPVLQTIANGWWGEHWGPKLNSAWGPPGRWPSCCQQGKRGKTTWQLLELCAKASAHKEGPGVLPAFCSQTFQESCCNPLWTFISHPTHLIYPSQLIRQTEISHCGKINAKFRPNYGETRGISLSSEAAGDELIKEHPEGK